MKWFIVVLMLMTSLAYAEVKQEPQKFEVKYTITYNAITLDEAAKKEKDIKKKYKDACKVEIKLEKPCSEGTLLIWDTNIGQ